MVRSYDAVLLLAFGGPTSTDEIRPFLARVLRGHPVPAERVEEVVRHYEAAGGCSPLNEITLRQAKALESLLREQGLSLPVYAGLRHARPFVREALDRMVGDGVRRGVGLILSPFQTEASWERYQKEVEEAQGELGGCAPRVGYCPSWHSHPLFIEALAEKVRAVLEKSEREREAPLIFTAHSVPAAMAARSPYVAQFQETSRLVAERLGHRRWMIAYQSRSGDPREPWLGPDIADLLRSLAGGDAREVVVVPTGFVCDHVEVLYDLDIEARGVAESLGMRFLRAPSLNDHPTFIRMMAEVIEATVRGPTPG